MYHLCGWLKLFLKKCGGGKNKKLRVGLSVGLLVARLKYGLYVGHLSKWFVFVLMFKFWSVSRLWNGRPTIGYNVQDLFTFQWIKSIVRRSSIIFRNFANERNPER